MNHLGTIIGNGQAQARAALRLAARIGLLAAVSWGTIAHAQDVAGGETELDAIVIEGNGDGTDTNGYIAKSSRIGSKTDTPLEKIPQSISVVTRKQMDDQQVTSVAESLRYTAGTFTEYRGASNVRDEIFLRGYYFAPRYLDGLLYATSELGQIDPYLLDSVEVLRGPSSVLFGQSNPGGIVNMSSKKPTEAPYREVMIGAGTDSRFTAGFDVSDSLSDVMRYRLAAIGLTGNGQEDYTKQQRIGIAPSVTWQPDAGTKLTVSAMYQHDPNAGYRNFLERAGTIDKTRFGYVPTDFFVSDPDFEKFTRDQASIGYQLEHEIDDTFTVRSSARYTHVDEAQNTIVWNWMDPDQKTVYRQASGGREVIDQFVFDNSVQAKFATGMLEHTLIGGVDYRYRERDYHWGRVEVASIDWTDPVYGNLGKIKLAPSENTFTVAKQLGVYAQDQIEIGKLNLLAGGRYDWASTDIDDNLNGGRTSYDDSAFSYRTGAVYNFDNGISPYVSYSTSFEPVIQAAPAGDDPFKPTTAKQFAAGVRYAPAWADFQLTGSYFDIEQKNAMTYDPVLSISTQSGKTRSRGVELSGQLQVNENVSLLSSYTYIDTEVLKNADKSLIGNASYRAPPSHIASIWGKYEFKDGIYDGLGLGLGLRYIGTSWGDEANTFKVPAVALVDASLSYDFGKKNPDWKGLSLQVNAKNLADKRYVASCASNYACFYGARRSVFGTLKFTW